MMKESFVPQSVELRDEILIQICKHLTNNPDMRSMTRGWLLMCLCVDLFPPSVKFELYLLNFLASPPGPVHALGTRQRLLGLT